MDTPIDFNFVLAIKNLDIYPKKTIRPK
jgi:hypothetical protein